jgi:Ca2+-binding EF-hand superfamily protein
MNFSDFAYFLLCEEDKDTDYSLDYFFSIFDVDGDGYLSYSDFQYFWPEMCKMMSAHHRDVEKRFDDIICQLTDLAFHSTNNGNQRSISRL